MRTIMRGYSGLLLGLLVVRLAGCGGEALPRCEGTVSTLEAQNQELQSALAASQDEGQKFLDRLSQSQLESQVCQLDLARCKVDNHGLKNRVASSQDENQHLQERLADARAEIEELRAGLGGAEPDLDQVRERLWLLFHDRSPAVWACDDTASRVVPVVEMPSASPADLVAAINARFGELNPAYKSPGLGLEGVEGDTAAVSLVREEVVTEQMGSTGAQCYLAGVTFSLTSFEGIDHVRFEFKEGSHGSPGRYGRADFVYFLPLEPEQP